MTRRPIDRCWALLLCVVAAAAVADDQSGTLIQIHQRGTLRVATTGDYRPFSFAASDQSRTGIDVDLAMVLAGELGVKVEWVDTSWATLLSDLAARRYDIAMGGVSITAERAAAGRFSTPYFTTGKTILARCAVAAHLLTLDSLNRPDVTVIVNPGGTNEQFVRAHLPHAHILVNSDNRSIFDALAGGAADAMVTDAVEAQLEAAAHRQLCAPTAAVFEQVDKAYLMPPDSAWQAWIDAWLERMRASGQLAAILRRYVPPAPAP